MNKKFFAIAILVSTAFTVNAQNNAPENEISDEQIIIKKRSIENPKAFLGIATQKTGNGIKVTDVVDGSAAEKSGLKKGDVVTKLNGKDIEDPSQFSDHIRGMKPGEEVELSVIKDGEKKERKVKAILGQIAEENTYRYSLPNQNENWDIPAPPPPGSRRKAPVPQERFGFRDFDRDMQQYFNRPFEELRDKQKPQLGIHIQDTEDSKGVKVIDVTDGSNAEKAGIEEDDLITDIDGARIIDTDAAKQALKNTALKPFYNIRLMRDGKVMVLEVKNPKKLKEANL